MNKINNIFRRAISYRTLLIILLFVFLLLLLPMLYVAKWNAPAADDFRSGAPVHDVVMNGGNIWEILKAAINRSCNVYQQWTGTFSGVFLNSLHPGVFGEQYYAIGTYILLFSLISGIFVFVNSFFKVFTSDVINRLLIAVVISIGCTQFPFSAVEGFYWYNGASLYTFFFGLSLILYAAMISLTRKTPGERMTGKLIAACVIGVIVGLSNFVTALTTFIFMATLMLLVFLFGDKKNIKYLIIPFVFFLLAFYLNITAPGNAVRQSTEIKNTVPQAVYSSVMYTFGQLKSWNTIPVFVLYALLCPLLWKIANSSGFEFRMPWLVTLYSFGLLAAMNCPPFYALSHRGYGRCQNLNKYTMIILGVINLLYWFGWLGKRRNRKIQAAESSRISIFYVLILAVIFVIGVKTLPGNKVMTSAEAIRSYRSGEMGLYKHVFNQRLEALYDPEIQDAVLRPYPYPRPRLFYFDDITQNPEDWRNESMSAYYHKNSVRLAAEGEEPSLWNQ